MIRARLTFIKAMSLVLVFFGIIAIYFYGSHNTGSDTAEASELMPLPVVTMNYEGEAINTLRGYTSHMEASYMHDVITPVAKNHKLEITIGKNGNNIAGISYELRSTDTTRLVETVTVEDALASGDTLTVPLTLSTMAEADTEFLLILNLSTEQHGVVTYYTRVIMQTDSQVDEQLEFVRNFSDATFDDSEFENYIGNLEIDSTRDNTNLADVDIHSSFNNLTWGNLGMEAVGEKYIFITDLSDDLGSYVVRYTARALNDYDTYQYYDVTEFLSVRIKYGTAYLYVYDRKTEQIFDANTQNISSTRINLGLDPDLDTEYKSNSSGSYVAFVKNDDLWMMDLKANEVTCVFSFAEISSSEIVPSFCDTSDINIVSVDDEGNVLFLVYGYMAAGAHEGSCGVSLYKYYHEDNSLKELTFLPSSKPFDIFSETVGKFAYLTEDNTLYFMMNACIYTSALESSDYVLLASNLTHGNYVTNSDSTILAWHENSSEYSADSIRVLDVERKSDYIIKADSGDYVKVLGFVGKDLIYGTAHISDIYTDSSGNTVFPMYRLDIITYDSDSGNEVYAKDGFYVSEVTVSDNTLSIERLTKNSDGSFSAAASDKLISRSNDSGDAASLSYISTTLKSRELILSFAYTITGSSQLEVSSVSEISYADSGSISSSSDTDSDIYYVYAYGHMYNSFDTLQRAVSCANSVYGTVVDGSGATVWRKTIG